MEAKSTYERWKAQVASRQHKGATVADGLIGIFWLDGNRIVAFPFSPQDKEKATDNGEFIDSNDGHHYLWPQVTQKHPEYSELEYFEIPRGRVVFNRWQPDEPYGTFIVYSGSAIIQRAKARQLILATFKIKKLQSPATIFLRDEHYDPYQEDEF